ncbi:hypothetical protein BJF79_22745 [Actinomadura sp. CNU-125]|uniref:helix-turn-helix domain-containing protein n=1 Tax=Actinomadura sp. CNU-125 TaxID=1904961 RepID=UPI000961D718|nr:helix-turn-helix transcriptional regulator [Actinomadura sp. CNU-125]OLT12206.1 hypothetical protein BJF79_22745 [Actinomadura sp. CNU-125]
MASNLAKIRGSQGISTTDLSRRLKVAGRPITATGITKIEKEGRRVDVDDLVALAVALGVNPNALLFPDIADETSAEVTGCERPTTAYQVWQWADGREPLRKDDDPDLFHVRVRPRGRRRLASWGERSSEELERTRAQHRQIAKSGQYDDPAEALERLRRLDPEAWEGQ